MKQIVECVANISEGKDHYVISKIAAAIRTGRDTVLLHIDTGVDANRTVFTFAGPLSSLKISVLHMYDMALQCIDMREHTGTHPRIGVVDVCPFIPIQGIEMNELILWVSEIANQIGEQFSLPVFLYEHSASQDKRKNLVHVRQGEYEGLRQKLTDISWQPDFGSVTNYKKTGATIIGAREFLLAYNVNIKTSDVSIAKAIARQIRGSGYKDSNGKKRPGLFKEVKAIGWFLEKYGHAQVSMNLTNYKKCSFHQVYEACKTIASDYNTSVTGSELIGLTPLEPLRNAGLFYGNDDMTEEELIELACTKLGLSDTRAFISAERVIEYLLTSKTV